MDNVIPICVIPATTPRITSYIPMALIKEFNKECDTVICLTMCDRLQDENIEELLINRIVSKTDEYNSETFTGVCGVINRTHKNNCKLSDNDINEKLWFRNNIYDQMPADYMYKKCLFENLGIENLVSKLSSSYKKFVCEKWIPDLIAKIETNNCELRKKIDELGFDPTDKELKKEFIIELKNYLDKGLRKIINLTIRNDESDNSTNKFYRSALENEMRKLPMNIPISVLTLDVVSNNMNNDMSTTQIIKNQPFYTFDVKILRFTKLIQEIVDFLKKQFECFGNGFKSKYNHCIEYDYYTCTDGIFKTKMETLKNKYEDELLLYMVDIIDEYDTLEDLFPSLINLEESTHDQRVQYHKQISTNNEAIEDLDNIIEQSGLGLLHISITSLFDSEHVNDY